MSLVCISFKETSYLILVLFLGTRIPVTKTIQNIILTLENPDQLINNRTDIPSGSNYDTDPESLILIFSLNKPFPITCYEMDHMVSDPLGRPRCCTDWFLIFMNYDSGSCSVKKDHTFVILAWNVKAHEQTCQTKRLEIKVKSDLRAALGLRYVFEDKLETHYLDKYIVVWYIQYMCNVRKCLASCLLYDFL